MYTLILTYVNSETQQENVERILFSSPFFPEVWSFADVSGVISILLGIVSIILSLIIYKLSNATSEKLAEDAARRAFEKQQKSDGKMLDYDEKNRKTFTKEQKKKIKKKLSVLCKNAQRYSNGKLWVHAASFPITLKSELNEDEVVELMYEWKNNNIISWGGNLETSTQVFIDRSELLIEDINSR